MTQTEFPAGAGQLIVVYAVDDVGAELDPASIFGAIAEDAARREADGLRIVSMTGLPLRHAAAFMAREGSGYQTKAAVAVVYGGAAK